MMNISSKIFLTYLTISMFMISSCKTDGGNETNEGTSTPSDQKESNVIDDLYHIVPGSDSGITFNNQIEGEQQTIFLVYEYAFNGGGVAIGDINNDGLPDILMLGSLVPSRLYLNEGNFKFRDITEQAGINNNEGINVGATMVDINNDGLLDIYICKSGLDGQPQYRKNALYINQGNLSFVNKAAEYNLDDPSHNTQAYFADFDLDGDFDVYLVNHPVNWGKQNRLLLKTDDSGELTPLQDTQRLYITDRYLVNENGKFVDKTFQYGLDNAAFGLSAVVYDFNNDNYPDIYVCNDYTAPDRLLINQKGKGFKDEILTYFKNTSSASMGSDILDMDNDGRMDLFVCDMMATDRKHIALQSHVTNYDLFQIGRKFGYHDQFRFNSFQRRTEDGNYSNIAFATETDKTDWSWACLSADFDHNTYDDLFITNGFLKDILDQDYERYRLDSLRKANPKDNIYQRWSKIVTDLKAKNHFFANEGNLVFKDVSTKWGIKDPTFSSACAYGDLDNDGDLDLVISNINAEATVMKNTLSEKTEIGYTRIKLKDKKVTYGTKLKLNLSNGTHLYRYFNPARGFISNVEPIVHFGYPKQNSPTSLEIEWLDGTHERFILPQWTGTFEIEKNKGVKIPDEPKAEDIFSKSTFPYTHKENTYIDFKREPLLHMEQSSEGPCVAVADFNGDGEADVAIGSAANEASAIYFQEKGKWKPEKEEAFLADSKYEDVDVAAGDLDKDGDIDLVFLSGGYQWKQ